MSLIMLKQSCHIVATTCGKVIHYLQLTYKCPNSDNQERTSQNPHRRSHMKKEEKMPSKGVPVDPILLHVVAERGEIREITPGALTTGRILTLAVWRGSSAPTVRELYALPCASYTSGGGMPLSMS